ncbi:hypothetical protein L9F63_015343, partial [Diploptera punctata]
SVFRAEKKEMCIGVLKQYYRQTVATWHAGAAIMSFNSFNVAIIATPSGGGREEIINNGLLVVKLWRKVRQYSPSSRSLRNAFALIEEKQKKIAVRVVPNTGIPQKCE